MKKEYYFMNEQDSLFSNSRIASPAFLRASTVAVHITGVDRAYIVM